MKLRIQELTAEAFSRFGEIVDQPKQAPDAAGPDWQWWAHTASLSAASRAYSVGFYTREPGLTLSFEWAERHDQSPELLIPLNADCLVYVGDTKGRPSNPEPSDFHVFRLRRGQGAIVRNGIWHGAPLALDEPLQLIAILLEDTGALDTRTVQFPESPILIDRSSTGPRL